MSENSFSVCLRRLLLRMCAALVLALCFVPASLGASETRRASLDALLTTGVQFDAATLEQRQAAIETARVMLAKDSAPLVTERARFGVADGYLKYQLGDVSGAIESVNRVLQNISLQSDPSLYVRARALQGGLQWTSGESETSLQNLKSLLAQDLSQADPYRVAIVKINYATSLGQNRQIQDASLVFEDVVLSALQSGNDALALRAGRSYVDFLGNLGLLDRADYWVELLAALLEKHKDWELVASFRIYIHQMQLRRGESDSVVRQLEAYLGEPAAKPHPQLAHAETVYSDALLAQKRLSEAAAAAGRAVVAGMHLLIEAPARLALVRASLALGDYESAAGELSVLNQMDIARLPYVVERDRLVLQHALLVNDTDAAQDAFAAFNRSNQSLVEFLKQQQTSYFDEKLSRRASEVELESARETQALLATEAQLQAEQVSKVLVEQRSLRQQRWLIAGIGLLLGLAIVGWFSYSAKRAVQTRLRENLRRQNESLSAVVEQKSQALIETVREQAKLEQALAEHRHMEAIGQIAGHVAHDFNNILQVVSGANDLISDKLQADEDRAALDASSQSVRSGSSSVRQLLAYSRKQNLDSAVIGVADFLRNTQTLFRSSAGEVNRLIINDHANNAAIDVDAGQLAASLMNLIRNAVEAMKQPGEIILSTEVVPSGSTESPGQMLRFQVTDHGCGMGDEVLAQASRPYFTTRDDGTGLGLSSVYGFVEQSGGRVTLESEVGEGTRVSLLFPLHRAEHKPKGTPSSTADFLAGKRVLLVEDNELIARTMQALFVRMGAEPTHAGATDEAQRLLESGQVFDLMLTDIRLPGPMDGIGLADWVAENYPGVSVGLMSGYRQGAGSPDVPVLEKPFTADALVRYLAERQRLNA